MFRILALARRLVAIALAASDALAQSDVRFRSEMRRRGVSDKFFDYLRR